MGLRFMLKDLLRLVKLINFRFYLFCLNIFLFLLIVGQQISLLLYHGVHVIHRYYLPIFHHNLLEYIRVYLIFRFEIIKFLGFQPCWKLLARFP